MLFSNRLCLSGSSGILQPNNHTQSSLVMPLDKLAHFSSPRFARPPNYSWNISALYLDNATLVGLKEIQVGPVVQEVLEFGVHSPSCPPALPWNRPEHLQNSDLIASMSQSSSKPSCKPPSQLPSCPEAFSLRFAMIEPKGVTPWPPRFRVWLALLIHKPDHAAHHP